MTTLGQLTMLLLLAPAVLLAQHEGHDMSAMSGGPMVRFGAGVPMNRFASGTSWIPDDVTLPSQSWMAGDWHLMAHGYGFLQLDHQSGPRGADQLGSLNWGMLMASRPLGAGASGLALLMPLPDDAVNEIVDSDFFNDLTKKAGAMRAKVKGWAALEAPFRGSPVADWFARHPHWRKKLDKVPKADREQHPVAVAIERESGVGAHARHGELQQRGRRRTAPGRACAPGGPDRRGCGS